MATLAQIESARRNGAKSKGPVTDAGKRISSLNALQHGLTSRQTVVLCNEDPAIFTRLVESYKADFKPRTPAEDDLVAELALCRWRLRRVWEIETALLDLEILNHPGSPTQQPPENFRVALAWKSLAAEAASLVLLDRYETRIRNAYSRTLRDLQLLRSGKLNPPNEPEPVESKPKFEPLLVVPQPSPTPERVTPEEFGQPIYAPSDKPQTPTQPLTRT